MKHFLRAITRPRSLRTVLLWPYVGLTLALALAVGVLSYRSSAETIIALTEQLLDETAARIVVEVQHRLNSAGGRLYAALTLEGIPPPIEPDTVARWHELLWIAAYSVDPLALHFVYYGAADGRFVGVERQGDLGELRLGLSPDRPREIRQFAYQIRAFTSTSVEDKPFDPRQRVWYQTAVQAAAKASIARDAGPMVWSPIHNSFRDGQLSVARSRALFDPNGKLLGVVATDISLTALGAFVESLKPSANGLALLVQADGQVVATSVGPQTRLDGTGRVRRLNADEAHHPLVRAAWAAWQAQRADPAKDAPPTTGETRFVFDYQGNTQRVAVRALAASAPGGMPDWIALVVVPDDDQLGGLERAVALTASLGALAAVLTLLIGLRLVGSVVRAIRNLQSAALRMGRGELNVPLPHRRRDEIGQLARSLDAMQTELSTDRLTGLTSRTALQRQLAFAIEQAHSRAVGAAPVAEQAAATDASPAQLPLDGLSELAPLPPTPAPPARQFALLFLDLNGFKAVNDQLGHDAGDAVLAEVGQRLRRVVRPGDVVARLGGDEFVVVLWRLSSEVSLQRVIDAIHASLGQPLNSVLSLPGAPDLRVGTAVGSAFYPEDGEDSESLLKAADSRMYAHKANRAR